MVKENRFIKKFSTKSSEELFAILDSRDHVIDAKIAAKYILEERGKQVQHEIPENQPQKPHSWFPKRIHDPEHKKHYEWQMLTFGITIIIGAFYINFMNLITTNSSLVEVSGTIHVSDVIIENVSSRGRFGNEAKSRKATLYFRLNEHQKFFKLHENIGQDHSHEKYEEISRLLNQSNVVSVWISKYEQNSSKPKVFQIDVNEETILDFKKVKTEHMRIFILMLLIGMGLISFALYSKYPKLFKRILNQK